MEPILCNSDYSELFDKFMISIKDDLYTKFHDYIKNNNLERNDSTQTVEIIPKKKGRGRPKKNTEENKQDNVEKPKKRGRGRPKKDTVEILQMTVVKDTEDEEDDSKKRGRPNSDEREVHKKVFEDSTNNCDDSDDDDETDVVRIEIEGNIYLRDGSNKLYNMSDQEYVGVYDEVNGTIVLD